MNLGGENMKRLIIAAIALAVVPLASAEMYKYVDKNGKTVYTDQPPADADAHRIAGPSSAQPAKSFVEKDKELQKGRDKAADDTKKAADKEKVSNAKKENCDNARQRLAVYTEGGRVMKQNKETGEREFLSDDEIESERVKAQKDVTEACGK
jgi:hypothetical protein